MLNTYSEIDKKNLEKQEFMHDVFCKYFAICCGILIENKISPTEKILKLFVQIRLNFVASFFLGFSSISP